MEHNSGQEEAQHELNFDGAATEQGDDDELQKKESCVEVLNGTSNLDGLRPVSANRPGRLTNQLKYLHEVVLKEVWRQNISWPFLEPVNVVQLKIPDYHHIIKRPMDLGTIKSRLESDYYWTAKECLYDFMTMFTNCFVYNEPDENFYSMARALEKVVLLKVADMPKEEVEIEAQCKAVSDPNDESKEEQVRNCTTVQEQVQQPNPRNGTIKKQNGVI